MKTNTITVTEKNINEFSPYQGTTHKLQLGEVLTITSEKVPCVRQRIGMKPYFAIVTNWIPTAGSLYIISRANEPEAEKYGWDRGAEIRRQAIEDKKEDYAFNRYSINHKFLVNFTNKEDKTN